MKITSAVVGYKLNPQLKLPEVDNIEKALLLIDKSTRVKSFEIETSELEKGLKLIEKILDGMRVIQVQ
jgi:hypothetical protein